MANWKKVLTEDTITTGTSLGTSDVLIPSQNAVKTYVDAQVDTADTFAELTDTTVSSVANLDVLSYSTSTSKWRNATLSGAGIAPKAGDASQDFAVSDLTLGGNSIKNSAGNIAISTSSGSTNVTFEGAIQVGGNVIKASDSATAITLEDTTGNVTIAGDLTVTGKNITTTAEVLQINDNTIVLNADLTGTTDVDAGIVVERGGSGDNATFYWDEGDDRWRFGTNDDADLSTSPTYASDVMQVRIDGSAINTSSTEVPIGHLQYHNGELYLRVED